MRPIDADALKEGVFNKFCEKCDPNDGFPCEDCALGYMIGLADQIRTLTLDDLRSKGEWVKPEGRTIKSYVRRCSACGKDAYFCGKGCSYKYCPNCGAKMEVAHEQES